jgi:hypothetical protein
VAATTKSNKNPAAQMILKCHQMQTHKQMHLESLNLTLDSQPSKGDEWERECSTQEDVKIIKKPREFPRADRQLFISIPNNKAVKLDTADCTG